LVECIGAVILFLVVFPSWIGRNYGIIVGGALVYLGYRSIKTRRRFALMQLREVQRARNRIILRFRPEAHMRNLALRAISETAAQEIEQALRSGGR